MAKYIFRGYDNPHIEGKEVYYGEGSFTVGKEYLAINPDYTGKLCLAEARFKDDRGHLMYEELAFFDIVGGE